MSKSAINTTLTDLQAAYTDSLATLLGYTGSVMFRGGITITPGSGNTVSMRSTSSATRCGDVAITDASFHEYSAVDLATIYVKGTAGDTVTLVGEGLDHSPLNQY